MKLKILFGIFVFALFLVAVSSVKSVRADIMDNINVDGTTITLNIDGGSGGAGGSGGHLIYSYNGYIFDVVVDYLSEYFPELVDYLSENNGSVIQEILSVVDGGSGGGGAGGHLEILADIIGGGSGGGGAGGH